MWLIFFVQIYEFSGNYPTFAFYFFVFSQVKIKYDNSTLQIV